MFRIQWGPDGIFNLSYDGEDFYGVNVDDALDRMRLETDEGKRFGPEPAPSGDDVWDYETSIFACAIATLPGAVALEEPEEPEYPEDAVF